MIVLPSCTGINDCHDDETACAALLNGHGKACAQAYQLKHGEPNRRHCEDAVDFVGDRSVSSAIPGLVSILEEPESGVPDDNHRADAANALGKIGDSSALEPLLAAIDLEAGRGAGLRSKMANRTHEEIATALGRIGDRRATPALIEMMEKSSSEFVVLEAVRAVGRLRDDAAVEPLEAIALEHANKFMRKNAVVALGEIGSPAAVDTLIQMMFIEYQGVSFYREASFALFQVGPPAADQLLDTLAMKNEEVNAIFERKRGSHASAIKAKCGFVLGDLRDSRALQPLLEAFQTAIEPRRYDPVVLSYAAPPLGALGDPKAIPVLTSAMGTLDPAIRDAAMNALVMIGDPAPAKAMVAMMSREDFLKRCRKLGHSEETCLRETEVRRTAQEIAGHHASNLAGPSEIDGFQRIVSSEPDEALKSYLSERAVRLEVAAKCEEDAACWAERLSDPNPLIRERAGWQLRRLRDPSTLDALAAALSDPDRKARFAAIHAYWTYGDSRAIPQIERTLDDERSSADFIKVNEDLRRLLVHLRRS